MQWLLALGFVFSIGLVSQVAGIPDFWGSDTPMTMDDYMEQFKDKARYLIKNTMDMDGHSYTIEENQGTKKVNVNDGYQFDMCYNAYAFSENKLMTKRCTATVLFKFDGTSDPKITKGPDCKKV